MDLVGVLMGWVTVPMAMLTVASIAAGFVLLVFGAWQPVLAGLVAFVICYAFAAALERVVISVDDAAARALARQRHHRARLIAIASGAVPVAAILAWELLVFGWFGPGRSNAPPAVLWCWCYGVAVGPWTLFALRVSRFRRTLCGIRAYAGHLAFWVLSAVALTGRTSPADALPLMLLPATLPVAVGMLLALADRDALTNVRI